MRKKNSNKEKSVTEKGLKKIVTGIVTGIVDKAFEKFAIIMKRSFDDVDKRFDDVSANMVTKKDFEPFRDEMIFFKDSSEKSFYNIQTDITDLKTRMGSVESRLDRIEPKLDAISIMQIQ